MGELRPGTVLPASASPAVPQPRALGPDRFPRCERGTTISAACNGLADDLLELGYELPSVYLLAGQRLRCHAARGYFQVVDGFMPGTGVIGRVVASGRSEFIPDVATAPEFIGAVPDIAAEACFPVRMDGRVVGAVNVESHAFLPEDTPEVLSAAATLLGARLSALGGLPQLSPAQRLAQIAVELTAASTVEEIERRAVGAAVELSAMSSAVIAHVGPDGSEVTCATGPLAGTLREWRTEDLLVMASWVRHGTSSHFPGGEEVPAGYAFLRASGVRAVAVHPLVVGGLLRGLLVVADSEPVPHPPSVVDALELLSAQTAASLGMAGLLREVSRRAERDELTGLRNRHGFTAVLSQALAVRRQDEQVAVLLFDLDDFKHVNDSLGHQAGDRLLVEVADRLRSVLRADDTACRLGGDEFVVVLPAADEQVALAVAERMLDALSSMAVAEVDLGTTASVGIALTSGDDDDAESLLRAADLAMYLAKGSGKGRCAVFEPRMQTAAVTRMALTRDLRRALREERLELAYQPIVDLATGEVTAVEALARWNDPQRGPVPPSEFVSLAEETGDIRELGAWVLRTACAQLLDWSRRGASPDLAVCVNVSTRQLGPGVLLPVLDECLAAGVDPSRLVLEITETALASDSSAAERTLRAVRERGVVLAVDDFGTGYSSLGRLRSAPVSRLKVDRSFVHEIRGDGRDVPIVDAALAMAAGLGLHVVAEGVETPEQLDYLRLRGCPEAQGYLLSRPLPAEQVLPLLLGERPWSAHLG